MSNPIEVTRQMFTENEYKVFIKYDNSPQYQCYVAYDSNCVGFGQTPEDALSEWIQQYLEHGQWPKE